MGSNYAARAATAGELVKFRSAGQYTRLGLAIQQPATVYACQVNQTFTTLDGVAELTYDTGSGTLADVLPGMTVYVGTSAGAYDKGMLRVRKAPTATVLYINQVSDVRFADNDYLTVVNEFALWPRDIEVSGADTFMDFDVVFGSYLNGGAIPRIGPAAAVIHLVEGSASFSPPSPTGSACYDDETVASYLYEAPGAATTSDMGTATPSWTYDTAGLYRWSCTITDSLGRETTGYRWVFVDPDPVEFILDYCYGDYQSGYWQFSVTMFAGATTADIRERALCVLYAEEDHYNGTVGSVGKIAGYENIICTGWIEGESITRDPEAGTVTFTVRGPGYWLGKIRSNPFDLQDTSSAPASWHELTEMTVDKALAFMLYWTSTATMVMDCYFTGDTVRKKVFSLPAGSLLDQLNNIALHTIFAKPLTNNYGQLYIEIDPQLVDSATRAGIAVVQAITTADYVDDLDIQRNTSSKTALVEFSGNAAYDGAAESPLYSYAPGGNPKIFGGISSYNNYICADQDEANRLSGALLALENSEYEPLEIALSANNRLVDICPRMYCTISVAAGDTPRGITLTAQKLIPRRVEFGQDKDTGVMLTDVTCEFETTGVDGTTTVPLMIGDDTPDLDIDIGDFGGFGFIDFPNLDLGDWMPDTVPGEVSTPCNSYAYNSFNSNWDRSFLDGTSAATLSAKCYFPCKLRSAYVDSTLEIKGNWSGDSALHYHVYALKNGARVLTATVTTGGGSNTNIATFSPLSDTEVDGFEITLDSGIGTVITGAVPGAVLGSGTVQANNSGGASIAVTAGQQYAVENAGGPWDPDGAGPLYTNTCYMFQLNNSGNVGYNGNTGNFNLVLPAIAVKGEQISSLYGRVYFIASGSSVSFRVFDTVHPDNTGSLGYVLRSAVIIGRRITLGPLTIKNVCAI